MTFGSNEIVGSIVNTFVINVSIIGDFPISILPIPADTTLTEIPFQYISLSDYLLSMDNDSVVWSVISSSHLIAEVIDNEFLGIKSNN